MLPLSLASSLGDALLPRVTWPFHRYGCFAVVGVFVSSPADAWPLVGSLVDALPPLQLDGLLCRRPLRCCILFLHAQFVGFRCRGQSPSFVSFFLVLSFYPRSLTTSLVTCNMCYEGSLVAASYNFSLLNEKRAILPDREKKTTQKIET